MTSASHDPVHAAEVEFLTALAASRQPPTLSSLYHWPEVYRSADKARQRSRRAGRVFWQAQRWSITDEGRAWLAGTATPPRTATALEVGR